MGFELGQKQSRLEFLMTPGPIITLIGLLILAVSIFFFSSAGSGEKDMVDAMLESQSNSGQRLKAMIGLVAGTVVSIGGVLLSLLKFNR
ncbi:MAG: hypothetical protein WC314_11355 [Vulcanimicrobiota bacterium]